MKAAIALGLGIALLASTARAESRISGTEAEALAIATRTFKSKQGTTVDGAPAYGDLRHYTVQLEHSRNRLEITFVPDQPRQKRNEAGTGGSTINGWEVAYVFSLKPLKLLEEHYAR